MIQFKDVSFTYSRGENAGGIYDINLTVKSGETLLLCGEIRLRENHADAADQRADPQLLREGSYTAACW